MELSIESSIYKSVVSSDEPPTKQRDGGWTEWSPYSSCISECVSHPNRNPMGIMVSKRKCENPVPYNGGKECDGNDKRVKLCDATQVLTNFIAFCANISQLVVLFDGFISDIMIQSIK